MTPARRYEVGWTDDLRITSEEIGRAVQKMGVRTKAPGPDEILGRVCVLALKVLEGRVRDLFNECLRKGKFPEGLKRATAVLLPKMSKPHGSPSAIGRFVYWTK